MSLLLCPDGLLVLAVLFARLLLAGSAALFCGILSAVLVSTHVVVFTVTRAAQNADATTRIAWSTKLIIAGVPYDMRLYSVILLAIVVLIPAIRCIRAAATVAIGAAAGWRSVVRASLLLIAVSVPLIPLQPFALLVAVAAFISLETAFMARGDLTAFVKRRSRTVLKAQVPRLNSVSAR